MNPYKNHTPLPRHRSTDEYTLPYYGGLKGQFVNVKNGKVQKHNSTPHSRQGAIATALSSTIQPSAFEDDFNRIQLAAARLVTIQESAKQKGTFSKEDNQIYASSLLELGQAAQNLAMLQQTGQIRDFSVLLKPLKNANMPQKTPMGVKDKVSNDMVTIEAPVEEQKIDEVTEQHLSELDLLPVTPEDPYEDPNDSVAVMPPKKDASVAEAKPVAVSIAGEGGVASAKPNAVALSGRNGLAVSAPKATAIAGVTPEEAAAYSISLPSRNHLVIKSTSSRLAPSAAPIPTLNYDDYDYIESSPVKTQAYSSPLLRSSGTVRNEAHGRIKPMQATATAAESIVKLWRSAITDDFAAPGDNVERLDDYDVEQLFKISKKLDQHRRV